MLIIEIAGTRLESIMAARNKDTDKYDIASESCGTYSHRPGISYIMKVKLKKRGLPFCQFIYCTSVIGRRRQKHITYRLHNVNFSRRMAECELFIPKLGIYRPADQFRKYARKRLGIKTRNNELLSRTFEWQFFCSI